MDLKTALYTASTHLLPKKTNVGLISKRGRAGMEGVGGAARGGVRPQHVQPPHTFPPFYCRYDDLVINIGLTATRTRGQAVRFAHWLAVSKRQAAIVAPATGKLHCLQLCPRH